MAVTVTRRLAGLVAQFVSGTDMSAGVVRHPLRQNVPGKVDERACKSDGVCLVP
jgi:hypothetical protein